MKTFKKITILCLSLLITGVVSAQFLQTDWSGGGGQTVFNDPTMFNYSFHVDFTSFPGDLIAENSNKSHVYGVVEYNGKLLVSSSWSGTFIYDPVTTEWEFSHVAVMINYTNTTIHTDGKLYVQHGYNIFRYDGTYNDYGMGPNGWELHSNLKGYLSQYGSSIWTIHSAQNRLMVGCRVGYSARVIEWNETTQSWNQMGNPFTSGVCSLVEYNGTIYAGTHWAGQVYKWTGTSWTQAFDTPSMSIVDLEVHDGYLYLAGSNDYNWGRLYRYNGSSLQTIKTYYGYRVYDLESHGDVLAFTVRGSNNSPGVEQYNGSIVSTLYPFNGENTSVQLCSYQGDLYYGGVLGTSTSVVYKNGQDLETVYIKGVISSEFPTANGLLNVDATNPSGSGTKVFVQGKNNPTYNASPWVEIPNGTAVPITEDVMRYWAIQYTVGEGAGPTLHEISIGNQVTDPLLISVVSQSDVSCFGGNDGAVEVVATGGTPPYTYNINGANTTSSNTLYAGTYLISVTDALGEESNVEVVISEPDQVNAYAGEDALVYYGYDPMASTQLAASGGISYSWSPVDGLDDPTIANPIANPTETTIYTVTVTDQFGCSNTDDIIVEVIDVRCGKKMNKVLICHNDHTICVSENAVQAHLNHGDYLGECMSATILSMDEHKVEGELDVHAFPNPFQRECQIEVTTPHTTSINIYIYDVQGRLHSTIFEGILEVGKYTYHWDYKSALNNGIYFVKVISNSEVKTIKLIKN